MIFVLLAYGVGAYYIALVRSQTAWGVRDAVWEAIVELIAGHNFHRSCRRAIELTVDQTVQLTGSARVGHDHQTAKQWSRTKKGSGVVFTPDPFSHELDNCMSEGVQIGDADEPRPSRGDH